MDATRKLLVDLSHLACSVIIIGVGSANFDAMNVLDGDGPGGLTDQDGRKVARDLVQFVEFQKIGDKNDLAKHVL